MGIFQVNIGGKEGKAFPAEEEYEQKVPVQLSLAWHLIAGTGSRKGER